MGTAHYWRGIWARRRNPSTYAVALVKGAQEQDAAEVEEASEVNPEQAAEAALAWPIQPDPSSLERRRDAGVLVQAARVEQRGGAALPAARESEQVAGWDRDLALFLGEADRRGRRVEVGLPTSLSASALMAAARDREAFEQNLVRPMPQQISAGASIGQRFHDWVQARFAPQVALDLEPTGPGAPVPDDVMQRFIAVFGASEFAEWTPLAVEEPFVLVLGDVVVRGRIDAVYVASGDFDYLVVDWKTSRLPADPLQLALYRFAWAEAMGVAPERVDAAFVHLATGEVVHPASLPQRPELMRLVTRE